VRLHSLYPILAVRPLPNGNGAHSTRTATSAAAAKAGATLRGKVGGVWYEQVTPSLADGLKRRQPRTLRKVIEGLRAIAILAVVL
jgi:hypothetical protein